MLETVELAKGVYLDVYADVQAVGFEILNADAALLKSVSALPETSDLASCWDFGARSKFTPSMALNSLGRRRRFSLSARDGLAVVSVRISQAVAPVKSTLRSGGPVEGESVSRRSN